MPATEEEWIRIAREFEDRWNFPHCVGALDGEHIVVTAPINSGSYYYNYKHSFSIVLLALVNANYEFMYVDVGSNGRVSDGGIFRNSSLFASLQDKSLNIPPPDTLIAGLPPFPYVIVADDAFPRSENIMKPFSHKSINENEAIFNYRLSRARRISENAFGMLANRFRVFLKPIKLEPKKVELITLCSCALHNFLRIKNSSTSVNISDAISDARGLMPFHCPTSDDYSSDAKQIRNRFCDFFYL